MRREEHGIAWHDEFLHLQLKGLYRIRSVLTPSYGMCAVYSNFLHNKYSYVGLFSGLSSYNVLQIYEKIFNNYRSRSYFSFRRRSQYCEGVSPVSLLNVRAKCWG